MAHQFSDHASQIYFVEILHGLLNMDPSIEHLNLLTFFLPEIGLKYKDIITSDETAWTPCIREVGRRLMDETRRYNSKVDIPSLQAAYRSVFTMTYPRTYKFSGNAGLNYACFESILNKYAFTPASSEEDVGILTLDFEPETSRLNKIDVARHSIVRSILGSTLSAITNKEHLYTHLMMEDAPVAQQFLAETISLKDFKTVPSGSVWIVRPVGPRACSGRGISVITTDAELEAARTIAGTYKSAIVSRYVHPPLLWQGRKFHIRMYYLVRAPCLNLPFYTELWHQGTIMTAALPYEGTDWNNKLIHDTHGKTTPGILWFPQDLPDPSRKDDIFEKMQLCMKGVSEVARKHMSIYPESIYAYEVFGCDFLVGAEYEITLMEINDRIGHIGLPISATKGSGASPEVIDAFSHQYFEWIYDRVIGPIYASVPS